MISSIKSWLYDHIVFILLVIFMYYIISRLFWLFLNNYVRELYELGTLYFGETLEFVRYALTSSFHRYRVYEMHLSVKIIEEYLKNGSLLKCLDVLSSITYASIAEQINRKWEKSVALLVDHLQSRINRLQRTLQSVCIGCQRSLKSDPTKWDTDSRQCLAIDLEKILGVSWIHRIY